MNNALTKLLSYLSNPPAFLRNKYVFTLIVFGIFIGLFDKNSLIKHYHLFHRIEDAKELSAQYKHDIAELKAQRQALLTDQKSLEKFGREAYLMKKENEEIILFVPPKEEPSTQ